MNRIGIRTSVVGFLLLLSFVVGAVSSVATADDSKPNFLIIMADDCTHSDLPLYGGKNAKTPNLDQLASQGLVFNRAYVSEAMCQPCRSELYTGQHPMRNGAAWNHSGSRADTTSLPQHLGKFGYRVGIAGKKHVTPRKAFPFENVGGFDPSCVRDPTTAHELAPAAEFVSRSDDPFCLVVALVEPHVPWVMGDASAYPPEKIKLPKYLADTEVTREAFSRYLAEITYMDGQVGEILHMLELSGKADDTLVLFTSEQGSQFPGCKWTNWDSGLHTGLIARWPGKIAAEKRTDAIVQYADVAPTLVELAGGDATDFPYDGGSFASCLFDSTKQHREYAYGIHNNIPEGPSYPIRTVTNGEYRYIRNLTPDEIYIEKHLMGMRGDAKLNNPYWSTWVFQTYENPWTERMVKRYMKRPAEQLYHTATDPEELNNLADDVTYAAIKKELSAELDRWMEYQRDPGVPLDTREAHKAAKQGRHKF